MRKLPFVIQAIFCAAISLACGTVLAGKTMSIELFQLHQFELQFKQLAEIYAAEGSLLLENEQVEQAVDTEVKRAFDYLGISERQLDHFEKGVADFAQGTFFNEGFQCGAKTYSAFRPDTTPNASAIRLAMFAEHGARLLWGAMELGAYREAVIEQAFSEAHLPAICKRVETLHKELECLAEEPAQCQGDIAALLKQIPLEIDSDAGKVPVFAVNAKIEPIKNTLHPYIDQIAWLVSEPDRPLARVIMEAISIEPRNYDALEQLLRDTLITQFQRQASVALFDTYLSLPNAARELIENDELRSVVTQASVALDTVRSYRAKIESFKDEQGKEIDGLVKKRYDRALLEAEQVVEETINEIGKSLRVYLNQYDLVNVPEKIDNVLDQAADTICDSLEGQSNTDDWGPNMWGVAPTEKSPIGFRFVFSSMDDRFADSSAGIELYEGELQLLVYIPPGTYQSALMPNTQGEKFSCAQEGTPTYAVLRTGYLFENAYKDITADISANGFLQYTRLARNKTYSTLAPLASALEKLGVISEWLEGEPSWSVSSDYRNVSVTVRMLGKEVPIQIIEDGVVVLNATDLGRQMCQDIESTIMPELVSSWASGYRIKLGEGWSLSVKGGGQANIEIAACDNFYDKAEHGLPHPLLNSDLAVNAKVVLNGVIHGDRFQWPASANLVVKKRKPTLKSLVFGDTPGAVKKATNKLFQRTQHLWAIGSQEDLMLNLVTGSLVLAPDMASARLPVFIQVGSSGCATKSIAAGLSLPKGELTLDSGNLEEAVKSAAVCTAQRTVNEYIANNVLQCDNISGNVFGLTSVVVAIDKAKSTDMLCHFVINGQFANQPVTINDVKAHKLVNGRGFKLDFSDSSVDSTLVAAIRSEIQSAVGDMASYGVIVDNPRFSAQSLLFELSFTLPAPIGTIEVGTITLSAETGQVTVDSELERILAKRVIAYLTPKLNTIIESVAPDFIRNPTIPEPEEYRYGKFELSATFEIDIHEKLPLIPAELKLLPKLSAEIYIDKEVIEAKLKGALNDFVFDQLPLKAPPVEAKIKDYYLTPSYEVTLIASVKIGLDELGEIGVDSIYINDKGVAFRGRAELRVGIPIYLVPAPIPVVLTRPGIFYDFDEKEVGALGALTVIAPDIDKLLQIDVALGVGDPNKFITQLTLGGDLVLLNSIPVIMAKGTLDFERLQITFKGETSDIFKAIMDASIEGDIKPKPGTASLTTHLGILGAKLMEAEFTADIRQCPKRCIKGGSNVHLLIGNGHVKAEFGPLLVDALLDMGIVLEIFGKKYSTVDLEVESLRAHLEGKILKVLKLSIRTPGLKEMSPSYIAEVIASLLEVDLKDILSWLEKPKIEIAPAGSGDADGANDGKTDGDAGDSSSSNQSGQGDGIGAPPPTSDAGGGDNGPPIEQASQIPEQYRIPQRFPVQNGYSLAGCSPRNNSWGFIVYYSHWNIWGYVGRVWGMPQDIFDKVCQKHGNGRGPWDHLKVFAIKDNWHPLYTLSQPNWQYAGEACELNGQTKECVRDFPSYRVSHWDYADKKEQTRHPRTLNFSGRLYNSESAAKTTEHSVGIKLDREVAEDLAQSKVSDPYLQKILRAELRKQADVKNGVITDLFETEIGDGEGAVGRVSGFFSSIGNAARKLFNSSTLNYTVTYEIIQSSESMSCHEVATVFSDKSGSVMLSHNCHTWKNNRQMKHFTRQNSDAMNQKVKQMLSDNSITINPGTMTVLTKQQTHWYLNIAMPSLLSDRDIPSIGSPITPDPVVGQCGANINIDSIYVFDSDDNLSLNITKKFSSFDGASRTESSQLLIAKRGGHKAWAESKNPALLNVMASFLSCQTNPVLWLDSHRLWLEPQGDILLFYPVNQKEGDHRPVLQIKPKTTPRTVLMPLYDPYTRVRPTAEVKQRLYDRVKSTSTERVSLVINANHQWEAFVKEDPGNVIYVDLIHAICFTSEDETDFNRCAPLNDMKDAVVNASKKTYKLDAAELSVCFANFGPTQIRPSRYDYSGIFHYLGLEHPAALTGIAPHRLFRELHHHDTRSCKPL